MKHLMRASAVLIAGICVVAGALRHGQAGFLVGGLAALVNGGPFEGAARVWADRHVTRRGFVPVVLVPAGLQVVVVLGLSLSADGLAAIGLLTGAPLMALLGLSVLAVVIGLMTVSARPDS